LAPAANTTLNFNWNTTGVSPDTYTIKAVADTAPGEIDTANNILTDGTIKINFYVDLNGDGKITITDIVIVALCFGEEY